MKKRVVVLGGGTAGTMVVNRLHKKLNPDEWSIAIVDKDNTHVYQPGLLLLPFGVYSPAELVKRRNRFFPDGVEYVRAEVERVDPEAKKVYLEDGLTLDYDQLVLRHGQIRRSAWMIQRFGARAFLISIL